MTTPKEKLVETDTPKERSVETDTAKEKRETTPLKRKRGAGVLENEKPVETDAPNEKLAETAPDEGKRAATAPDEGKRTATAPDEGKRTSMNEGLVVAKQDRIWTIDPNSRMYRVDAVGPPADPVKWERYFKSIHESEGFDVKDYPGPACMALISPINVNKIRPFVKNILVKCAEAAIATYNNIKRKSFEFKKLEAANRKGAGVGTIYYVTFSVVEKDSCNSLLEYQFQARVYHGLTSGKRPPECKVFMVRTKPRTNG